jgi:acyl carrier protein
MGLDGVELIMATEQEFGITITDDEAEKTITVGDLYALVQRKLSIIPLNQCASANAFYRMRRHLVEFLGIPRKSVTLDRKMDELVDRENRRERYKNMGSILGFSLPDLTRPAWMEISMGTLGILSFIVIILCLIFSQRLIDDVYGKGQYWEGYLFIGSLVVFALVLLIYRVTEKLSIHFPGRCSTLRDMIGEITTMNYGKPGIWNNKSQEKDVRDKIKTLIIEQLGIAPEKVIPEAEFVKDLGVD